MSDLKHYFHMQDKRRGAYSEYNYAGAALKLADIDMRLAEIKSQHEPLAGLVGSVSDAEYQRLRKALYAAAFYVVVGRMPE